MGSITPDNGHDQISPSLSRRWCWTHGSTYLFDEAIHQSCFPTAHKAAEVGPQHKQSDVIPEIMLLKLFCVGVWGAALEWFSNYLNERMQKLSHRSVLSDALPISHGVPQGSQLGLLLFILFINDLPKCITNCKIALYADDTVLLFSAKTSEEIRVNIQEDLHRGIKQFKENRLHLNVKKTKWSLLGTYQKNSK